MRKVLICLLILSLILVIPCAFVGCKKDKNVQKYDIRKYKEKLDLSGYELVFSDEFDGDLDRSVWGDTRQGTRRDGYWTKNLAFTDGEGHLVIRTEKRGSRYCSDTKQRTTHGANDSVVKLTYDDCYPFGIVAGDFGDAATIHTHTTDLVGNVILSRFEDLGALFTAVEIPQERGSVPAAYTAYFDVAKELYSYYSFVREIKAVDTPIERSAIIGANYDGTMTFGSVIPQEVDLRAAVARLYGFDSEEDFLLAARSLADARASAAYDEALASGGFLTTAGDMIFPIALRNDSDFVLTYVIVDGEGRVSVWLNDVVAALKSVNYDATYYAGNEVNNEIYCKNILFVTGPEGVYSGALRTRDLYTHGFGYYEIRCKLPSTEGIWHAFWMMCGDVYDEENGSTDGIEIDVFEYLPNRDSINCALHWDGYDEAHQNAHMRFEKVGCADDEYHTFGMNWDETGYTFYIDGRKVWHSTGGGICREEGYMKISTEYGEWGDWVGTLDLGDLPVDWVIDYVKIYDKK